MTVRLILGFMISFAAAILTGRYYVPWLRKIKAGQEIREVGPNWQLR